MAEGVQSSGDGRLLSTDGHAIDSISLPGGIQAATPFGPGGYDASRVGFGGIGNLEGRVIGANALWSPTGTHDVTDNVLHLEMATGADTTCYANFALEEWWLAKSLAIYVEWTNLHSTTGDVVLTGTVREVDIGTQGPATGSDRFSFLVAVPDVPAGRTTTTIMSSVANGNGWTPSPGALASYYALRLTRLGTHVSDTLDGPIGIVEVSYVSGQ